MHVYRCIVIRGGESGSKIYFVIIVVVFILLFLFCSSNCASRYVQIMADSSLSARKEVLFYDSSSNSYYSRGRLCGNQVSRRVFRVRYNVLTVNYHTDNSNAQGLTVNYELTGIVHC